MSSLVKDFGLLYPTNYCVISKKSLEHRPLGHSLWKSKPAFRNRAYALEGLAVVAAGSHCYSCQPTLKALEFQQFWEKQLIQSLCECICLAHWKQSSGSFLSVSSLFLPFLHSCPCRLLSFSRFSEYCSSPHSHQCNQEQEQIPPNVFKHIRESCKLPWIRPFFIVHLSTLSSRRMFCYLNDSYTVTHIYDHLKKMRLCI